MSKPLKRPIAGPKRSLVGSSSQVKKAVPGARAGPSARGGDEGYLYVAGVRDASQRVSEYRAESDVCPVCHTDRQFNKNLRLLVSPCYHKMCESCIDRLFTLGPEPCPQCGRVLRKVNFAHQTFEDLKVEKEVSVRRRMAEFFNKRRDDFGGDREYDDYLEEVEDLTFNLLNGIDLAKTEARIAEFQRQNKALIAENQSKAALEALSQAERDEVEKRAREERMEMVANAERVDREQEERAKGLIGEALMRGDKAKAQEIRERTDREKAARVEALARAVPPSLTNLLSSTEDENDPDPLSAGYNGPYVAIPYSDPSQAAWTGWCDLKPDYVDGREGVWFVKEDKEGKVRGGGYDLRLFWEMEIRSAVEGLGIEPMM